MNNHCTQDAGSTTSRPAKPSHVDTAIALRGFSTTTAAHALRFYTEARFILNILIVISTITKYVYRHYTTHIAIFWLSAEIRRLRLR